MSYFSKAKTAGEALPATAAADPYHAELIAKRDALSAEARPLRDERLSIIGRMRGGAEVQANPVSELRRQSAALLGEAPPKDERGDRQRLRDIDTRLQVIDGADTILAERVRDAERRAAQRVVEQAMVEYRQLVAGVCAGLIRVHQTSLELDHFIRRMADQGADASVFNGMTPDFVGRPHDHDSPLSRYLKRAAKEAFISTSAIPAELAS